MPLDHIALFAPSTHFSAYLTWYDAALAPLGYKRHDFIPNTLIGMAADGATYDFWIHSKKASSDNNNNDNDGDKAAPRTPTPMHFAFKAETRDAVREFHKEAVRAGGKCNGEPGLRGVYHENYYAAYVIDPWGNNIEVVDQKAY